METTTVTTNGVTYVVPNTIPQIGFYRDELPNWEPETFEVFESLPPGKLALDIGAWVGPTAIWLASKFDKVIAFEPDSVARASLTAVVACSSATNIDIVAAAVAAEGGLKLHSRGDWGNSQSFLSDSGLDVETVLIQDLRRDLAPDFIKCDIEGGEASILSELLQFKCPVLVSFHLPWWRSQPTQAHWDAMEARLPGSPLKVQSSPWTTILFP